MNPPHSGCAEVTLTNQLLKETGTYCQLNPAKRSQAQLSKVSLGRVDKPLTSTEPVDERPDTLHMDINITTNLVTIAERLFYHKQTGQPLKYTKTENDKKSMDSCSAQYHQILRHDITTLCEITQNPGN